MKILGVSVKKDKYHEEAWQILPRTPGSLPKCRSSGLRAIPLDSNVGTTLRPYRIGEVFKLLVESCAYHVAQRSPRMVPITCRSTGSCCFIGRMIETKFMITATVKTSRSVVVSLKPFWLNPLGATHSYSSHYAQPMLAQMCGHISVRL